MICAFLFKSCLSQLFIFLFVRSCNVENLGYTFHINFSTYIFCNYACIVLRKLFCIVFHQNLSKLSILVNINTQSAKDSSKDPLKDSSKRFESFVKDSSVLALPQKSTKESSHESLTRLTTIQSPQVNCEERERERDTNSRGTTTHVLK
jgi:hypothetical protein